MHYIAIVLMSFVVSFSTFASEGVCFSPDEDCRPLIEEAINGAQRSILVQAYTLTDRNIADALINAHEDGISVKVITDKVQMKGPYSLIPDLVKADIPVLTESVKGLDHIKVYVIDREYLLRGSYNSTEAARSKNSEGLEYGSSSKRIVEQYIKNWFRRAEKARPVLLEEFPQIARDNTVDALTTRVASLTIKQEDESKGTTATIRVSSTVAVKYSRENLHDFLQYLHLSLKNKDKDETIADGCGVSKSTIYRLRSNKKHAPSKDYQEIWDSLTIKFKKEYLQWKKGK